MHTMSPPLQDWKRAGEMGHKRTRKWCPLLSIGSVRKRCGERKGRRCWWWCEIDARLWIGAGGSTAADGTIFPKNDSDWIRGTVPHEDGTAEANGPDDQRILHDVQDLHAGRVDVRRAASGPLCSVSRYERCVDLRSVDQGRHHQAPISVDVQPLDLLRNGHGGGCSIMDDGVLAPAQLRPNGPSNIRQVELRPERGP